jgi:hypothetical protein
MLNGVDKANKVQIRVGACVLLYAVWNVRKGFMSNKKANPSFIKDILARHSVCGIG